MSALALADFLGLREVGLVRVDLEEAELVDVDVSVGKLRREGTLAEVVERSTAVDVVHQTSLVESHAVLVPIAVGLSGQSVQVRGQLA